MYLATDPEEDGITWDIAGTDAARFEISESGELSFKSSPDYEKPRDANKDNVYEVTVSASDGSLESTLDIEVTVTNVNEGGIISGLVSVNYAENGTVSVATYTATDPEGEGITWGIEGTDAARFSISESGELSFKSSPDYEKPRDANKDNVYEVTVTASDGNLESTLNVEVTVTNVNEGVTITGAATVNYAENGTGNVETYSATDPEGEGITWGVGGTDAARFEISESGELSFKSSPDYEKPRDANKDNVYEVTVTASDGDLESTLDIEVTVTNANEGVVITGSVSVSYAENGTTSVATYSATDPEGNGITWGIEGTDAARFSIDTEGELSFKSSPDYENPRDANKDNVYEVTVTASDGNLESTLDVEVTVTNVNEGVTITGPATASYAENGTGSVETYSATDPEGEGITWSIEGTDAARFEISESGGLSFKSSPDYEKPRDANKDNVYEVTVSASDGNLESTLDVEVTVTDVNEGVTISGAATVNYAENGTASVATYSATDPEGNGITWDVAGADAARFEISESGGLSFKSSPDYEKPNDANKDNVYEVTVTASDGNLESTLDVEVTVTNVNEGVTITGAASVSYSENGTASVATYIASDPEGEGIAWGVGGTDAARFEISESGELSFKASPDYEKPRDANKDNVYEVTLTASDGNLESTLDVEVTVTNVNEVAVITGAATVSYAENGTGNVATYTATDPEEGGITWGVEGTDAAQFGISESGELSFKSSPDYEKPSDADKDNVYEATVTASDGDLTAELDVEVTVTNVNEGVTITGAASVSYAENGTGNVETYTATDPEEDGITWGIEGTDAARFSIDTEGELSFKSSPDYEKPNDANKDNVYEVTVTASDGNLESTLDIEVTVTNVNEVAVISGAATINYAENGTASVATYTATDPEEDEVTWSVGGADAAHFVIDIQGTLAFVTPPNFESPVDADANNTYLIQIVVNDDGNESSLDVVVEVTDANDAPHFPTAAIVAEIPENSCPGAHSLYRGIGGGVGFETDEDGDPLTYALSGADERFFVIHPPTGYVTLGPGTLLDFESSRKSLSLRVSVSDGRDDLGNVESEFNPDDHLDLTVVVTDVDELPVFTEAQLTLNACGSLLGHGPSQLQRTVTAGVRGGSPVGETLSVTDPEGQPVHFRVVSQSEQGAFIVDSETGQIMVAPDFSPRDARRVYTLRVAAMDGELESQIEVRIAVTRAPKSTPEPDAEEPSTPNPESEDDAEAPTPVQSTEESDDSSSDSSSLDDSDTNSPPTLNSLNRRTLDFKQEEPVFVPVSRAVQTALFGRSEVQDQTGHARLTAPAGTLAVPYQVRLTQDEAACTSLSGTAPLQGCVCVSVEFFDVGGAPLLLESLNRPAMLEIILRTQDEVGNSENGDEHVKIGRDSVELMMRQDDEQEWKYTRGDLREPADGSSVLMVRVKSPGQYMAIVTEPRTEVDAPASSAPINFLKPVVAQEAQNTVLKSVTERNVSFVYDPVVDQPHPQPVPVVSAESQAWYMARLMIALLLDVTVALSAGIFLQRITFRRH